jgi:predicted ester cyclase
VASDERDKEERVLSLDAMKSLVRHYMEDGFAVGDLRVFDETLSPTFLDHNGFADQQPGLAEVKREYRLFRQAFPDLQVTIEDLIAGADRVVIRTRLRATHSGVFQGRAPTRKRIVVEAVSIFRIEAGKIVERWGPTSDFMRQLTPEP